VSEPAFAGLFGIVLLDEHLTGRGWIGAGLILLGMLAAELGPSRGTDRGRGEW
jgi:drug/metabolite transporter (DMT)-like permease